MVWFFLSVIIVLLVKSEGFRKLALVLLGIGILTIVVLVSLDNRKAEKEKLLRQEREIQDRILREQKEKEYKDRREFERLFRIASEEAIPPNKIEIESPILVNIFEGVAFQKLFVGDPNAVDQVYPSNYWSTGTIRPSFRDPFELRGRLRNRSERFDLLNASLLVTLQDCISPKCETIGKTVVRMETKVPAKEAREIRIGFRFGNEIAAKGVLKLNIEVAKTFGLLSEASKKEDAEYFEVK